MNVLLLSFLPETCASTSREHVDTIKKTPGLNVVNLDFFGGIPPLYKIDENYFDCLIIHYSIVVAKPFQYLTDTARAKIRAFKGPKIAIIQDEYRWVNRTVRALVSMKVDGILTVCDEGLAEKIYQRNDYRPFQIHRSLTGFVNKALLHEDVLNYQERPIDIGYRGRKLPYWLGSLGYEKTLIYRKALSASELKNFKLDLSIEEDQRLYDKAWFDFIKSCKAMFASESGSSIIDFDDSIRQSFDQYEQANPKATFEETMKTLKHNDGELVLSAVSPRIFECAALRTLMILFPGTYNGILEPHRHYIPLNKDFSNIAFVTKFLKDENKCNEMIQNTYNEIAMNRKFWPTSLQDDIKLLIEKVLKQRHVTSDFLPTSVAKALPFDQLLLLLQRVFAKFTLKMIHPISLWAACIKKTKTLITRPYKKLRQILSLCASYFSLGAAKRVYHFLAVRHRK